MRERNEKKTRARANRRSSPLTASSDIFHITTAPFFSVVSNRIQCISDSPTRDVSIPQLLIATHV